MKDKLKKIWEHIWYIFIFYVLIMSSSIAVAMAILDPKHGLSVLFGSLVLYVIHLINGKKEK